MEFATCGGCEIVFQKDFPLHSHLNIRLTCNSYSNAKEALLKSRFCGSGGGLSEKLFESRRRRDEFFSRRRSFRKIVGFQYSLDFFGYFLYQTKSDKNSIAIQLLSTSVEIYRLKQPAYRIYGGI